MCKNINQLFGNALSNLRKQQAISQEELAYRCGLHRTFIGTIERGEKSPSLNTIEKLAKGLNLTILELWEALKID